ncbi:NAD-dependent epimerase/dehydratase family protein [Herbidospora sp. NEAU-GS84]|uniref:NAD-dependent epimerase/dehydratase family protein n=1 Tax=Herbidospora solisilvae TaxID=2696284 RepID=A0A7C9N4V3_9ACTN|nr:NAD-dependent epimerase/dehydratase family protein [Herbidospora solisilvae]NAS24574.1 NAD-dependent epimerase/dehydratase family protein [Herbidospora solisilvae]
MTNDMPVENTTVLVTGGTGHMGGHSVARLLREGYRVRVAVRHPGQEPDVLARLRRAGVDPGGRVTFVRAELTSDDNWDEAVADARYVWHHASPFPFTPPSSDDELIVPARDGALRVLAAARAAGVRRVVLTSSYAAVGYTAKPGGHYDESDWTDPADDIPAYIRSKTVAERAAWEHVREHGGPELTVVNPTGVFGPLLDRRLSASTGLVKAFLEGVMPVVPRMYFGVVDVRDVVDLHLRAMTHPDAAGERFIGVGGPATSLYEMGRILARHLPTLADRMPGVELTDEQTREGARTDPALREAATLGGRIPTISNEKARKVLGWSPRDLTQTITDTADSLIALGVVRP